MPALSGRFRSCTNGAVFGKAREGAFSLVKTATEEAGAHGEEWLPGSGWHLNQSSAQDFIDLEHRDFQIALLIQVRP
jgi:hypothetical protein